MTLEIRSLTTHSPSLVPGTMIDGRYRVEHRLGSGGVGTVYLVEDQELGQPRAAKVLHAADRSARHRERLLREVAVMASIHAPNITRVFDHGTHDGTPYSIMEYLPGRDLRAQLRRSGWLPWPRVREILCQTVRGLSAAYEFGVLHRDIKPSNVFLVRPHAGDPLRVKLLDFGLAKALDERSPLGESLTAVDVVMGTVRYLAPERARGAAASIRSEIYSLGVLAFECLCGRPPLPATNPMELIRRRLCEPPPSVRVRVPGLPRAVDDLLLRAMARDPAGRFGSLAALEAAILAIPAHEGERTPGRTAPGRTAPADRDADAPTRSVVRKTRPYGAGSDGLIPFPARMARRPGGRWSYPGVASR